MSVLNVFKTTTSPASPLDGSGGNDTGRTVSDFVSVQSFTNFAAMTGAISAAWWGLQRFAPWASALWVPYAFAAAWAVVSFVMSLGGLKKPDGRTDIGALLGAIFVAVLNVFVLAGAVIGTGIATGRP